MNHRVSNLPPDFVKTVRLCALLAGAHHSMNIVLGSGQQQSAIAYECVVRNLTSRTTVVTTLAIPGVFGAQGESAYLAGVPSFTVLNTGECLVRVS